MYGTANFVFLDADAAISRLSSAWGLVAAGKVAESASMGAYKFAGAFGWYVICWQSTDGLTAQLFMADCHGGQVETTIIASSDEEALFLEQAKAMYAELNQTADDAPDGEVLARAEMCALIKGRELVRKGLESVVQQQAEDVEKKVPRPEDVLAEEFAHRGRKPKTLAVLVEDPADHHPDPRPADSRTVQSIETLFRTFVTNSAAITFNSSFLIARTPGRDQTMRQRLRSRHTLPPKCKFPFSLAAQGRSFDRRRDPSGNATQESAWKFEGQLGLVGSYGTGCQNCFCYTKYHRRIAKWLSEDFSASCG